MLIFRQNPLYFWRMVWGNLRHADWNNAYTRFGPLGWILEFFRAISGFSAWPFFVFVARGATWRQPALRALLAERGIDTWGWQRTGDDLLFHVNLRQAHWAQYLLQEAGVPLSGQLLDGNGYGARRRRKPTRGHQAPRGGYRPTRLSTAFSHSRHQPEAIPARAVSPRGPLNKINRLVDRLAAW